MGKKKVNPRNKPATMADVNKAKQRATNLSINTIMYVSLMVLHDKYGFGKMRLNQFLDHVNSLSDSVSKRYVSISDLTKVLREVGIEVKQDT